MTSATLRDVLRPLVVALKDSGTHEVLPSICARLGIPFVAERSSKRERMSDSFDALPDTKLPYAAERLLELHPPSPRERNRIQDLVWAAAAGPELPKRFRRELARAMDASAVDLYLDPNRFDALLESLWVLDGGSDPMELLTSGVDRFLRAEIDQHVHRNPEDWSVEYLFDKLGVFEASDRRFALFLEGLASSEVRPDEASQRQFVEVVNVALRGCGVEMREIGIDGGYPVFSVISTRAGTTGRPKNLIFASSVKPDLRFRDAVNNDIEIVDNADRVLVYDRPISSDGLRWRDLQSWWSETRGIDAEDEGKKTLYQRLRGSLPKNSPAQVLLFDAFHRGFGSAVPHLPALLPEVWLHWDPKTVKERGPQALMRFRMDFLLLLPGGARIVIEVDGKHHYSRDDGRADCDRYATMVAADRDLKLAGYDVFRFGAFELDGDAAPSIVKRFFDSLFKKHGVVIPSGTDT